MRSMPPSPASAIAGFAGLAEASFVIGWRSALAGWPVLMGRCLFFVLIMLVLGALWDRVASERLPGTLAASLPPGGLALYVGVTEWITLSIVSVHLRLEDDIRSGALEPHLLRPKSYLAQKVFESFGGMAVRLAALGATGLILLALSGRDGPPLAAWAAVGVLGVGGAVIGVLLYVLVGLCAFWLRRVLPALLLMQKLMFMLGGLFAPIWLYPEWLYAAALPTPFAAHIYFAGDQALHPSAQNFAAGAILQLVWIAVLALSCAALWRAGVRRVLRLGGV